MQEPAIVRVNGEEKLGEIEIPFYLGIFPRAIKTIDDIPQSLQKTFDKEF